MPRQSKDTVAILGIDIGKNTSQLVGLNNALPDILATRTGLLAPRLLHLLEDLIGDWRRLDRRIHAVSLEIQLLAQQDPAFDRLMAPVHASGSGSAVRGRPEVPFWRIA